MLSFLQHWTASVQTTFRNNPGICSCMGNLYARWNNFLLIILSWVTCITVCAVSISLQSIIQSQHLRVNSIKAALKLLCLPVFLAMTLTVDHSVHLWKLLELDEVARPNCNSFAALWRNCIAWAAYAQRPPASVNKYEPTRGFPLATAQWKSPGCVRLHRHDFYNKGYYYYHYYSLNIYRYFMCAKDCLSLFSS